MQYNIQRKEINRRINIANAMGDTKEKCNLNYLYRNIIFSMKLMERYLTAEQILDAKKLRGNYEKCKTNRRKQKST